MIPRCHDCSPPAASDRSLRRVLWLVLTLNLAMFAVEIGGGLLAGSLALWSDALDFLGDSANFAISLAVLGMSARRRAAAALVKGLSMGAFGLWIVAAVLHKALTGGVPDASIMGAIGAAALAVNVVAAVMLYRYRGGDANRRSLWLCSRNDALGNLAVLAAASGVVATDSGWPDLLVAAAMATLALVAAAQVVRLSLAELRPLVPLRR